MDDEQFDEFLQSATLAVHEAWTDAGGDDMGPMELQALNDLLTQFFGDKRTS